MNQLIHDAREFVRSEEGATAIEYCAMAALVAVAILGSIMLLRDALADTFDAAAKQLKPAR